MCVHTRLLSLSSGLCRSPLAPATLRFCIKRLVNDYFFPSHDFTALDGFQISSPTSCTSLQLIAQKADQPASHRQRGLGEQYTKLLGFGNAGSLPAKAASSSQPGVTGLRGTGFHFPWRVYTALVLPTQEKK